MKTTLTALGLMAALSIGIPSAVMANELEDQASSAKSDIQSLAGMHPNELEGKTVQTQDGQTIGEIQKVVISDDTQQLAAVVDAGDFLNSSDADSAIPIGELQLQGDNVVLMSQDAKTMLQNNKYDESKYSDADESGASHDRLTQ